MGERLKGKIAVVIGAGQTPGDTIGNGRASAILYARESAKSEPDAINRPDGLTHAELRAEIDLPSTREHSRELRRIIPLGSALLVSDSCGIPVLAFCCSLLLPRRGYEACYE
jgi:hypothetical protein